MLRIEVWVSLASATFFAWMPSHLAAQDDKLQSELQQLQESVAEKGAAEAELVNAQEAVNTARAAAAPVPVLVDAWCKLGAAQLASGNFLAARDSYAEAVKLADGSFSATDSRLLSPLRGLGHALAALGQHREAEETLERALAVSARTQGLLDLGQADILRELANSRTQIGRYEAAEQALNFLVQAYEHAYGRNDPRVLPAHTSLAQWYAYVGAPEKGRIILRKSIRNAEDKLGKAAPELNPALRALGRSYLAELVYGPAAAGKFSGRRLPDAQNDVSSRYPRNLPPNVRISRRSAPAEGEEALLRALEIAEAAEHRPSVDLPGTLIDLGDWFQFRSQHSKAMGYYGRVAQASPAAFSSPLRIFFPFVRGQPNPSLSNEAGVGERVAIVEFTVTKEGITTAAKIIDSDATEAENEDALAAVRVARYRPRFVNGSPVDTPGMRHRQRFAARHD